TSTCRSPLPGCGYPSMGAFEGIGMGPGSLSSPYSVNLMFTSGEPLSTMYGIPMDCPAYRPEPKSGCRGVDSPMKLMYASEFGSTGAAAMFWFQRLSAGNRMNPFRLAPMPRDIPLHPFCAGSAALKQRTTNKEERSVRIEVTPRRIPKGDSCTITGPR